jgi:probable HAF family extracellular repeat protein
MKRNSGTRVAAALALLALPFALAAQEPAQEHAAKHKHYTLVEIGTFGGPHSQVNGQSVVINREGTVVGGASTSIPDPACNFDAPYCFHLHAFEWRKGALADLGTLPGGENSLAISINTPGTIAGVSENGLVDPVFGAEFVATVWNKNGQIVDLGTLGGSFSLPNSINDRGEAAGGAENTSPDPDNLGGALIGLPSPTQWHAALWKNGTIRDLGTLGDGPASFALFVNQLGQVAGMSYTSSVPNPVTGIPPVDPFFWENGRMVDIGTLGGAFGIVGWLNNRGQVVGQSDLAGDLITHAFLWEGGAMNDLGTLGGSFSRANSINDEGEVIGASLTAGDQTLDGFLWRHGVMTDLGTLPGDTCSNPTAINSRGQIVGESFCNGGNPGPRAVIFENGSPIDLNTLIPPNSGLLLREAMFINDRGEIAGAASLPNGDGRAFVLIPNENDEDDDGAASATAETRVDATPRAQSSTTVAGGKLTPEMVNALRTRLSNRHRGFGLRPAR